MDTELLRTFLEVERTGHFGNAADILYLTPAAVSARIRQLEGALGQPLFYRDRKRVTLTPAGEMLKPYAKHILDTWSQAVSNSPLAASAAERLALGGTHNLWEYLLQDYLVALHADYPELLLRAACHDSNFLASQLQTRQIDMAVLAEPLKLEGVAGEKIGDLRLVLYATERDVDPDGLGDLPYVHVDWSSSFAIEQQRLPGAVFRRPTLFASTGRIGLQFLLATGGAMYLPESLAREPERQARLFPVQGAGVIAQPVYVNYRDDTMRPELLTGLIERLIWHFETLIGSGGGTQ